LYRLHSQKPSSAIKLHTCIASINLEVLKNRFLENNYYGN
jgi:hypothetical protein